ncbi:MAG TPA: hypothetical protein VGM34_02295, partial [Chlamydiales bacterium]
MTIELKEMPASFTGQALYAGEHHRFLCMSPFDINQSFGSNLLEGTFKGIASLVYKVGVGVLCAPAGVLYHSASAVWRGTEAWVLAFRDQNTQPKKALAWEHVKAAVTDVFGILVAVPFLHSLTYQCLPNARISWWFSSTRVKTGYSDGEYILWDKREESYKIGAAAPWIQWGSPEMPSAHECPYNLLKVTEHEIWEKNRDAPPHLDKTPLALAACLRSFKETTASDKWWAAIWPKRLPQSIEQFIPDLKEISSSPDYKTPWQTIALAIGAIALVAITLVAIGILALYSPVLMRALLSSPEIIGGWISGLGFCLGTLASSYVKNRGEAELELANKLLRQTEKVSQDNASAVKLSSKELRENARLALFWLIKAASRGYVPSQRLVGLALLCSL